FVWRGRLRAGSLLCGGNRVCRCQVDATYWGDEAISAAGQGFDEARARCGVAQRIANFVYRGVEAVIEVDEGVGRPNLCAQLVPRHDLAGILQQGAEDLKRLFLKSDTGAVLAQFSGDQIDLKNAKAQKPGFLVGWRHRHDGAPVVYREK